MRPVLPSLHLPLAPLGGAVSLGAANASGALPLRPGSELSLLSPRDRAGLHRPTVPLLPSLSHSMSGERAGTLGGRPPTAGERPVGSAVTTYPPHLPSLTEESVAGLDPFSGACHAEPSPPTNLLAGRGSLAFADASLLRDYTSSLSSYGDSNRTSPASATHGTDGALGLYGLGTGMAAAGGEAATTEGLSVSGSGGGTGWAAPGPVGSSLPVSGADFHGRGGGSGGPGGGAMVVGGGGGGGRNGGARPQTLSASIAARGGGDPRLGGSLGSDGPAVDERDRPDARGAPHGGAVLGEGGLIGHGPGNAYTESLLFGAADGLGGAFAGVDGRGAPAGRYGDDGATFDGGGTRHGGALWTPTALAFPDAAQTPEEASYQQLAGLGPWTTFASGGGGHSPHGAAPFSSAFRPDARPFAPDTVTGGRCPLPGGGHAVPLRGGLASDVGSSAAAGRSQPLQLPGPPREPTFDEVHEEVRAQLRRDDPYFDSGLSVGDDPLHVPRRGGGRGRGAVGPPDVDAFPSRIWSFKETLTKEGSAAAAPAAEYDPWAVGGGVATPGGRGWAGFRAPP